MQLNQMTLFLYNWDTVTYLNDRCSMRTIVCTIEAKGYSVVVCLYPNNALGTVTNKEWPFAVVIGDDLLTIHPPPQAAEPAEVESDSQGDSDGSTLVKSDDAAEPAEAESNSRGDSDSSMLEESDDNSSHLSSTTDHSQVDPDFPAKPMGEKSNGRSTGARSLQASAAGSMSKKLDHNSSHLSSTTDYSQVHPDFPTGGYK
jgi:hypothetical protein